MLQGKDVLFRVCFLYLHYSLSSIWMFLNPLCFYWNPLFQFCSPCPLQKCCQCSPPAHQCPQELVTLHGNTKRHEEQKSLFLKGRLQHQQDTESTLSQNFLQSLHLKTINHKRQQKKKKKKMLNSCEDQHKIYSALFALFAGRPVVFGTAGWPAVAVSLWCPS